MNLRTGNGITRARGIDMTVTRYGTTPCGWVMRDGSVCQKPRLIGLNNKEAGSCIDHGEALRERARREYAEKRKAKKARGNERRG